MMQADGEWEDIDFAGRRHGDLLATIAQAMGLDIDTFGSAAFPGGALTELA